MATAITIGKIVADIICVALVGSIKTDKSRNQTVVDYRANPEVLDAILKTL